MSTRAAHGVIVAELAGELGVASAPVLREQFQGLLRPGSSRVVVDLSRVSSCDASGLAVLIGAGRRARLLGGFVRLAAVSPEAARVLQRTGLHRHFPVFPTVRAAAAGAGVPQPGPAGEAVMGAAPGPGAAHPGPAAASWRPSAVA
ncbi:MAG: STAS domain-containing protein [Streptosporangiales bacterium]